MTESSEKTGASKSYVETISVEEREKLAEKLRVLAHEFHPPYATSEKKDPSWSGPSVDEWVECSLLHQFSWAVQGNEVRQLRKVPNSMVDMSELLVSFTTGKVDVPPTPRPSLRHDALMLAAHALQLAGLAEQSQKPEEKDYVLERLGCAEAALMGPEVERLADGSIDWKRFSALAAIHCHFAPGMWHPDHPLANAPEALCSAIEGSIAPHILRDIPSYSPDHLNAARKVIETWTGEGARGKWRAANSLLELWGLNVSEPPGPSQSGKTPPLKNWWKLWLLKMSKNRVGVSEAPTDAGVRGAQDAPDGTCTCSDHETDD